MKKQLLKLFIIVVLSGLLCIVTYVIFKTIYNTCVHGGDEMGFSYSSLKVMSALFYEYDDSLYLIGGTEATTGIHNSATNSVFVYNISNNSLVMYEDLSNSISITSFCEDDNNIYFGTIDKNRS